MKKIKIRLASIDDFEDLVRLRILMQMEVSRVSRNAITKDYVKKVRKYFKNSIPTKTYFSAVAVFENRVIGTAGVCFYQKPPSVSGGTGLVGYVTNVYTEKEFRKLGIGSKMMNALVNLAEEKRVDRLHLGATPDGMSIYKSVGFKKPRFVNLEYVTKNK